MFEGLDMTHQDVFMNPFGAFFKVQVLAKGVRIIEVEVEIY